MGEKKCVVEKAEKMGPLGKPKHRWDDNIKLV
jgi:hypothetical protein